MSLREGTYEKSNSGFTTRQLLFPPMQMPSASIEEGVLIGIGSAILINSVMRDREHNDVSDYAYDHHDRYRWSSVNEFPAFRCRDNSVQCAYERGSGSVKGLFGNGRRITLTDAAVMGNVSKRKDAIDLVFLLAFRGDEVTCNGFLLIGRGSDSRKLLQYSHVRPIRDILGRGS